MEAKDIERINILARKAKSQGLTAEEAAEQQRLRRLYIDSMKDGLRRQLDATYILDASGQKRPIQKKNGHH